MYICPEMLKLREKYILSILEWKETVTWIAKQLSKSRKTIYEWIDKYKLHWVDWLQSRKPWPKRWSPVNRTSLEIEDVVCKIAHDNIFKWPIWIWYILEDEYWIKLHQTTIFRILKRRWQRYHNHITIKRPKSKLYTMNIPWKELQLDVSFPYWYARDIFTYSAIDNCTRYIWSKAYETHDVKTSIEFIDYLLNILPYPISAIRTDCWFEFSSKFSEYLESKWIKHIKNHPYKPQENWKIERYHRTWKEDFVIWRPYTRSIDEINYNNKLWVDNYNYNRRHTWLWMNGLTPIHKLQEFLQSKCYPNYATEHLWTFCKKYFTKL